MTWALACPGTGRPRAFTIATIRNTPIERFGWCSGGTAVSNKVSTVDARLNAVSKVSGGSPFAEFRKLFGRRCKRLVLFTNRETRKMFAERLVAVLIEYT